MNYFIREVAKLDSNLFQTVEMAEEWVKNTIDSNNTMFLVYEKDQQVVAFAVAKILQTPPYPMYKPKRCGYIFDLVADRKKRGLGIASKLLDGMVKWKKENHLAYLELKCIGE